MCLGIFFSCFEIFRYANELSAAMSYKLEMESFEKMDAPVQSQV